MDLKSELIKHLIVDEGLRNKPYRDTKGILTIGVGRNLERGLSNEECIFLLNNDIHDAINDLSNSLNFFNSLDQPRQFVLINMCFNIGLTKLLGFRMTLGFIENGLYEKAAKEMLNSKWASDVGKRAIRLAQIMQTGVIPE